MRERYMSVCKFGLGWLFFVLCLSSTAECQAAGGIPVKDGKHFVWRCGLESTLFEQICV